MKKILIIILIILLSGCYNYKELNKIAIVSSISIDIEGSNYLVGAQVMNITDNKQQESSKVIVYEETGKTIEEALRKITTKSNKKLYGGHLGKLVLSEEVAKKSIINVIDLFQRLPEIKDEFNITIVKGISANKVIKIMTSAGSIPADYVKNEIETSYIESALTYSSKLDEFVSFYLKEYIDPVISVIDVKNYDKEGTELDNTETTNPKTKIVLDYIAVTNDGKLEKYLNEDETIGYNFIRNNISKMIIPVKCDDEDNYSSISVLENKTKSKIKKENNKYIINLNINTNSEINEYNCSKDLDKESTINNLEKKSKNEIKKYIEKALATQKNTKGKFLGLERMIYLDYPEFNNDNYEVNVDINLKISKKGEVKNSSKGEKHEH